MSLYINTHNGPVYNDCNVTIINGKETYPHPSASKKDEKIEEVQEVDTSFFCSHRFTTDIIEKNLREAIAQASSKADLCRRIMALETQGYILISNVKDERKAELINPFANPKYTLTGDDFRKARNG